jgi:hypothetical protein
MARAHALGPWSWTLWVAAGLLTAYILAKIWFWNGAISKIGDYNKACGSDGWSIFGWSLAGVLTLGVGFAWTKSATRAVEKAQKALNQFKEKVGLKGEGINQKELLDAGDSGIVHMPEENFNPLNPPDNPLT